MKRYDAIIIGFGKGGKLLAAELANRNWKVAVIERSPEMYGGTCINVGCIPTKTMIHEAEFAERIYQNDYEKQSKLYSLALKRKDKLVMYLREKNVESLTGNLDARTKIHLQKYINSRTDSNEALFVSLLAPYERLQISGVEIRLRQMGKDLNIPKVHPHKFRRTLATMAIDKGMPIEQVQHLLGHQSLDTTLQYAMVNQNNVKLSHHKFIG